MKRRRWWRRAAWAALVLLALGALRIALGKSLGGWVAARERARFEREVGPLDPAAFAAPAVAAERNAVPAIAAAVERLALDESELELLARATGGETPAVADIAAADELLDARDGALAALAAAASRPESSFGPRNELFSSGSLALLSWLRAARLAALDGERALAQGNGPRLERSVAALAGMTRTLRGEPLVVFALVGAAVEGLLLDLVHQCLAIRCGLAGTALLDFHLAAVRELPDAGTVAHGEAVFGYDMLHRRVRPEPGPPAGCDERLEALVWPWSEEHVEAGAIEGWRELAAWARVPQTRWPSVEAIAGARHSPLRRWLDPTLPFETLRTILVPNLLSALRKLQFLTAAEQLAGIAAAVAREGRRSGRLPQEIDSLPAAVAPDAATGERPRYRRTADGGALVELAAARDLARRELVEGTPRRASGSRRLAGLMSWRVASPIAGAAEPLR